MMLQLGKDFLAQAGGDLRVNAGILNILVAYSEFQMTES